MPYLTLYLDTPDIKQKVLENFYALLSKRLFLSPSYGEGYNLSMDR